MVQIKGSSVLETVQAIKKRVGDAAFDKIVSLLDDDARAPLVARSRRTKSIVFRRAIWPSAAEQV